MIILMVGWTSREWLGSIGIITSMYPIYKVKYHTFALYDPPEMLSIDGYFNANIPTIYK